MKVIRSVSDINMKTKEGELATRLLARISVLYDTDKEPDEIIELANKAYEKED